MASHTVNTSFPVAPPSVIRIVTTAGACPVQPASREPAEIGSLNEKNIWSPVSARPRVPPLEACTSEAEGGVVSTVERPPREPTFPEPSVADTVKVRSVPSISEAEVVKASLRHPNHSPSAHQGPPGERASTPVAPVSEETSAEIEATPVEPSPESLADAKTRKEPDGLTHPLALPSTSPTAAD